MDVIASVIITIPNTAKTVNEPLQFKLSRSEQYYERRKEEYDHRVSVCSKARQTRN